MTGAKKTPFVISDYVRWGDVDLAGIIHYGAYLRFFELGETEIFRAAGLPFPQMFDRYDIWLPRKIIHSEFHSPAVLDEQLRVLTYFSRIGTTSLTINFDVVGAASRVLRASAFLVLVCVSRGNLQKRVVPPDIIEAIEPFTMSGEEARSSVSAPTPP
jgi:acyl-CoA thioester hydrolase